MTAPAFSCRVPAARDTLTSMALPLTGESLLGARARRTHAALRVQCAGCLREQAAARGAELVPGFVKERRREVAASNLDA